MLLAHCRCVLVRRISMNHIFCIAAAVVVILLAGCADDRAPSDASAPPAPSDESAQPAAPTTPAPTAATAGTETPFIPVATVQELMNSTIVHAAEEFWGSVTVVVDADGVHELYPETDEEWEQVWAAAITIAESGNLLMMAPRAVDAGPWRRYSRRLVEAGTKAAAAARAKDPEQVFATSEEVYNVCAGCHMVYSPDARETRE
jgi:hypothetical protein